MHRDNQGITRRPKEKGKVEEEDKSVYREREKRGRDLLEIVDRENSGSAKYWERANARE